MLSLQNRITVGSVRSSGGFKSLCSFNFDNSAKHLDVPNADLKDICTGANKSFAFGCSVKLSSIGSGGSILSDHSTLASKRIDVSINSGGSLLLLQYNAGVKLILAPNVALTTNWVNAVISIDGNTPSNNFIFVNGTDMPLNNNSLNGSTATSSQDFHIGNDGNVPVAPFGGYINQEFLIKRTVTMAECTKWYNFGNIKNPYDVWGDDCGWFFNPADSEWNGSAHVVTDTVNNITSTSVAMLEGDLDCDVNPYTGIQNKFDDLFIQSVLLSEENRYNIRSAASIFKFNYSGTYLAFKANPTMFGTFPDATEILVYVDGVLDTVQRITSSSTLYEITLSAGAKVVELVESGQTDPPPAGGALGTFITEVLVTGEDFSKINPSITEETITFLGDSITTGGNSSIWSDKSYAQLFRINQGIPTTVLGHGFATLADFAATTPLIDDIVADIVTSFQFTGSSKKFVISLGTNDFGLNALNATTFKTYYENLVDAVNTADSSIEIFCISPLIRGDDGALLDDYRDNIDDLSIARSFTTHIAGKTILTTGVPDFEDLAHPGDVGHPKYYTPVALIVTP